MLSALNPYFPLFFLVLFLSQILPNHFGMHIIHYNIKVGKPNSKKCGLYGLNTLPLVQGEAWCRGKKQYSEEGQMVFWADGGRRKW
jgi:hypothetical protein